MLNRIKSNKILKTLGFIIIALLIILIVRITYAFLTAEIKDDIKDLNITSDKVDYLKFIEGEPLNINATSSTLPENGTNLTVISKPQVSLIANDTTHTARYNYTVSIEIANNSFLYSNGSTPEIILSITGPNNEVISKDLGLAYNTFNGIAGYDITTYNGILDIGTFEIASDDSTTATIQEWNFTLTYLNQNFDQSANYGNSLNTKITMQKQ